MDYNKQYKKLQEVFEAYLFNYAQNLKGVNETLVSAVKYSLLAGGKRLRPVLMLAAANTPPAVPTPLSDERGIARFDKILPFALALEMIHTYSLIHDDLPCMDNDDLRRGKPSNHKVYGEAMATLAGDALLNLAFELMLENINDKKSLKAAKFIAECSGINGMAGGQAEDVECEKNDINSKTKLNVIHENKTAKLITAAIVAGFILTKKNVKAAKTIGYNLGMLFQLTDDLLDESGGENMGKTLGKDKQSGKLTIVKAYTAKQIEKKAGNYVNKIKSCAEKAHDLEFYYQLAKEIVNRDK